MLGDGALEVSRTPDTQFRRLMLYPPELRGRVSIIVFILIKD